MDGPDSARADLAARQIQASPPHGCVVPVGEDEDGQTYLAPMPSSRSCPAPPGTCRYGHGQQLVVDRPCHRDK